jgi:hypothetical protein
VSAKEYVKTKKKKEKNPKHTKKQQVSMGLQASCLITNKNSEPLTSAKD